jgi:hypothetical protein
VNEQPSRHSIARIAKPMKDLSPPAHTFRDLSLAGLAPMEAISVFSDLFCSAYERADLDFSVGGVTGRPSRLPHPASSSGASRTAPSVMTGGKFRPDFAGFEEKVWPGQ